MSRFASWRSLACSRERCAEGWEEQRARQQDGEIKGPRHSHKPLTWLGFMRASRSSRAATAVLPSDFNAAFGTVRLRAVSGGPLMSEGDSDFRVRPGRIKSTRAPKSKSFINQVLRASKKAGHSSGEGQTAKRSAAVAFDLRRGRNQLQPFAHIQCFAPCRHQGARGPPSGQSSLAPLSAHVSPEARRRQP